MSGPRDDEDDCDHELEVQELDENGDPVQRCRCGRVTEHMLVDGEDLALQEAEDTADTDEDGLRASGRPEPPWNRPWAFDDEENE